MIESMLSWTELMKQVELLRFRLHAYVEPHHVIERIFLPDEQVVSSSRKIFRDSVEAK